MADTREQDATAFLAHEIKTKAEPAVLAALAKESAVRADLSTREREQLKRGEVNSETAHKIAASAARDADRRSGR